MCPPHNMLRVGFSSDRDRVRRHAWISCFGTPHEEAIIIFKMQTPPVDNLKSGTMYQQTILTTQRDFGPQGINYDIGTDIAFPPCLGRAQSSYSNSRPATKILGAFVIALGGPAL